MCDGPVKLIPKILQELLVGSCVVGSPNSWERSSGQTDRPENIESRAAIESSHMDRGVNSQVTRVKEMTSAWRVPEKEILDVEHV